MARYFLTFVLGAVFGSFIGVVVDRLVVGKNGKNALDWSKRSHCLSCKKRLAWYELIPIVSYSISRGQCRSCGQSIPINLLIVELVSGLVGLLVYHYFGIGLIPVILFLFSLVMVAVLFYDYRHQLIPDSLVIAGLILGILLLIAHYFQGTFDWRRVLISVGVGAGFLLILNLISSGKWMGLGDAKLMVVVAMVLGWPLTGLQLYLSFIIGGLVAVVLLAIGRERMGSMVPFGPLLVIGYFISLFWGQSLIILVERYLLY